MMNNEPTPVLVVNKKTRVLYKYLGDDRYQNLITMVEGKLTPEDAKKYFTIPVRLNYLIQENENILSLIELGLFDFAILGQEDNDKSIFYSKKNQ